MAISHNADPTSNPEPSESGSQHLIQSQNTYLCFSLVSALASFVRTVYNSCLTSKLGSDPTNRHPPLSTQTNPLNVSTAPTLEHLRAISQQTIPAYNRPINDTDIIHPSIYQQNTFQDTTAQQELLSSTTITAKVWPRGLSKLPNAAIVEDHVGDHESGQDSTFCSFPAPSMFQGAQGFNISGNPRFVNIGSVMNNSGGLRGLEKIQNFVSFAALYNSSAQDPDRRCYPGTREIVLNRLKYWIDNPSVAEPVFWMYGPAGAGKTAIAQTIAHSFDRDKIAATFFFYRSDPARNNGNLLFTTLAWQLAFSIPAIKCHIVNSLDDQPDIPMKDVETQFKELIIRSFQSLNGVFSPKLSLVVIIDGIDECTDERLQQRFLKVIGTAVKARHIPLRFLISSRFEAHIQETVDRFECPVLKIDLDKLDDASQDIEKYLKEEFARIALEQDLDKTWPGQQTIQDLVEKSSGQFVYAATVIRYVGDPHNSAIKQLNIVRGLKASRGKSPFAELDALYLEVLKRQPDQEFLMEFLNLLIARSLITYDLIITPNLQQDLQQDDGMLMDIPDKELHRKLRRMRSLLKFNPFVDVYHRSFLDFLQDSSRSGKYYIDKHSATRRYLELIVDSLIRYASRVIEQHDYHETHHFHPRFYQLSRAYPRIIQLPENHWEEALRPLVEFQERLLTIADFISPWDLLPCDKCMVFRIIRDLLLHLAFIQGTAHSIPSSIHATASLSNGSAREADMVAPMETEQNVVKQDLDPCLSSLLTRLRETKLALSVNVTLIDLIHTLLDFDCAEIVMRIRSTKDAQNLVDLIDFLNSNEHFLCRYGKDAARKAVLLELRIFEKVPVLPQSLFLTSDIRTSFGWSYWIGAGFEILCQSALMGRILDRDYVVPLQDSDPNMFAGDNVNDVQASLRLWTRTKPSTGSRIQVMLKIAKVIQYFHSMDIIVHDVTRLDDFFLDLEFQVKIRFRGTTVRYIRETPPNYHYFGFRHKISFSKEINIFMFGCFFYELYFGRKVPSRGRTWYKRSIISEKPSEPEVSEDTWQLIQRCCAEDPKSRPNMDEIVREMETWQMI